jgi:large subunit ribosomal protein L31
MELSKSQTDRRSRARDEAVSGQAKKHPETRLIGVVCATCGTTFTIRSTASAVSVDVCSNCHPAYTGAQHAAARGDRIERFNRRRARAAA